MSHLGGIQRLAIESLFEAGLLGTAWVDTSLIIQATRGTLAADLNTGSPLCESYPPLFDMEQDLQAMGGSPQAELTIPNVTIVTGAGDPKRITIRIVWDRKLKAYTLILHPSDVLPQEIAMIRQQRVRRVAEDIFNNIVNSRPNHLQNYEQYLKDYSQINIVEKHTSTNPLLRLTPRETEVVKLVVQGHSNKVIAHELEISQKTVEAHRARALKRLGLNTSAELIRLVGEFGI